MIWDLADLRGESVVLQLQDLVARQVESLTRRRNLPGGFASLVVGGLRRHLARGHTSGEQSEDADEPSSDQKSGSHNVGTVARCFSSVTVNSSGYRGEP